MFFNFVNFKCLSSWLKHVTNRGDDGVFRRGNNTIQIDLHRRRAERAKELETLERKCVIFLRDSIHLAKSVFSKFALMENFLSNLISIFHSVAFSAYQFQVQWTRLKEYGEKLVGKSGNFPSWWCKSKKLNIGMQQCREICTHEKVK